MEQNKFSFVDLYCGAGFGARGLVDAGGVPLLAVDSWPLAARTYRDNFPKSSVVCAPVEQIDPVKVAQHYRTDLLLASPECTSHSVARGRKPVCETSRKTALHILPWVRELRPRWLIIENVARMRQWERHSELVAGLADLGFGSGHLSEVVLNAADFGAPQSRQRLFLIGDCLRAPPSAAWFAAAARPVAPAASVALDPPGTWRMSPLNTSRRAPATLDRAKRARKALGTESSFLLVYYGSDGSGGWQSLETPLRTVTTLDRFALVEKINGEDHMRMLQPTELKRAMLGLDLQHRIRLGNRRERVRLCGNGICAPVTAVIANGLRGYPAGIPSRAPSVSEPALNDVFLAGYQAPAW